MLHDPKEINLFPRLPENVLTELAKYGETIDFAPGDLLLREGERRYPFFAVLEGKVKMTKQVGGETQLLAVHEHGQFLGEISILTGRGAIATGIALTPVKAIRLEPAAFRSLVAECQEMGELILSSMTLRSLEVDGFMRQQEKLAALGKMSAGLAHELNNPAAAAKRAAGYLREGLDTAQRSALEHDCLIPQEQRESIASIWKDLKARCSAATFVDSLALSDREEELGAWLQDRGIEEGYEWAPALVGAGLSLAEISYLGDSFNQEELRAGLSWLESTSRLEELCCELENSMFRITDLVAAMKQYTYMDQASALQEIDVHTGIDSTLKIFTPRLKKGVKVERYYDPGLPTICAYPGELNQVWTNLIDNAIDAMNGEGTLTVRTTRAPDGIVVEIGDTGSGIPPEIQGRIFEPFFTTKGVGQGTGLGLDTTYRIVTLRHRGSIRVRSRPGDTRFDVQLPLQPPKEPQEEKPVKAPEVVAV